MTASATIGRRMPPTVGWLAFAFLLALALRLVWIAYADTEPTFEDDTGRYDFWGQRFADGKDMVNYVSGEPTAFGAPGYPLALGGLYFVVGHSVLAAQVLNAFLGAATAILVCALGLRVASRPAAFLAALLVAAFPSQVFFSSLLMTEMLYTALLVLALLLVVWEADAGRQRWPLLVLLGLVLGYGALVRGEALLLPLAFLVYWAAVHRGWRPALRKTVVVGVVMAAVIAPWTARNAVQMGAPLLLTSHGGVTLWVGHHEGADGRFQFADELVSRYPDLTTTEREVRINNDGFRESVEFALNHPLKEVELFGRKLFWMFWQDEEAIRWNEAHGTHPLPDRTVRRALLALSDAYYFAVLGLFVIGLALWFSWRYPARLLLVLTLAYWTLAHVVFIGDARYHFPIMVLVAIVAAVPLAAAWQRWRVASWPGRRRAEAGARL